MESINRFGKIIPFVEKLKELEEDNIFFSPISEGKWSSAAIISHLIFWDHYILHSRLPLMVKCDSLPKGDVDPNALNKEAEMYAHSGFSKNKLIEEFIIKRKHLLDELKKVNLQKEFSIGDTNLTIEKYIQNMVEHDEHHVLQIKEKYHIN